MMKRRRLDPQVRAKKQQALAAMEQILPQNQALVTQTLDTLLKDLDFDWGVVEFDNYQLLADRILEAMELGSIPASANGNHILAEDNGENPVGMILQELGNTQASSTANSSICRPNGNHILAEDNDYQEDYALLGDSMSIEREIDLSTSSGLRRMKHDPCDIARGMEFLPILCEGDASNLPDFYYISKSIIYQDAYVHFSHARIGEADCCPSCSGDCTKNTYGCACAETGEYAYANGCLRSSFIDKTMAHQDSLDDLGNKTFCPGLCPLERGKDEEHHEKCKGHLLRMFIKECWNKCGCTSNCGNRIVQRGIRYKLQVFWTPEGKGWGVRPLEDLPKGAFVFEYVGEILTNTELYERNKKQVGKHTYPIMLDGDWTSEYNLDDNEALCLDATFYGNVARFINHRCFGANLIDVPVEIECPDRHYYHVAFFTSRAVEVDEELTWDYGIDFQDTMHPIKAFHCLCGSQYCRQRSSVADESLYVNF